MEQEQILKLINDLIDCHEIRSVFGDEYYHEGAIDALNELKEEIANKFN
jgi:hypothetical protein